jgi:mRNA interferase RelE/StbE
MYEIEVSNSSKRSLKKADKNLCERVLERIKKLRENPFPKDCKRVEGRKEKIFRVRVGKYRIMYTLFKEQNKLLILDIDKREGIYDEI